MTDRTPIKGPEIVTDQGVEFIQHPVMPEGMQPPPMAVNALAAYSTDGNGGHWTVWQLNDGTTNVQLRIPAEIAPQMAAALHQGSVQILQRIQVERGPRLLKPGEVDFEALRNLGKQNGNGNAH